jgi:hypothetical protein
MNQDSLNKRLVEEIEPGTWSSVEKAIVRAMEVLKDYEMELDDAAFRYEAYKGMGQVFFHVGVNGKNAYLQIKWQETTDKRFSVEMRAT